MDLWVENEGELVVAGKKNKSEGVLGDGSDLVCSES